MTLFLLCHGQIDWKLEPARCLGWCDETAELVRAALTDAEAATLPLVLDPGLVRHIDVHLGRARWHAARAPWRGALARWSQWGSPNRHLSAFFAKKSSLTSGLTAASQACTAAPNSTSG